MIIANRTTSGIMAAILAAEIDNAKYETINLIDPETDVNVLLEDLLKFQLFPQKTMITSVEPVWIIDIYPGELEWARGKRLRSEWRLLTSKRLPQDAEEIFKFVLRADDLLPILLEWRDKTRRHNWVLAKWVSAVLENPTLLDNSFKCRDPLVCMYEIKTIPPDHYDFGESPEVSVYISSAGSKFFHDPDCMTVKRIKSPLTFDSINAAKAAGKVPCGVCQP